MHIVVLLAGVADTRRPLPMPASGLWRELDIAELAFQLSPFDEAVIEAALKLRLALAGSRLSAIVTYGALDSALLRHVASFRPDALIGLRLGLQGRWAPEALSLRILEAVNSLDNPADLILVGREHGDADDGVIAPYLAAAIGLPFVACAIAVEPKGTDWSVMRSASEKDEVILLHGPALISMSNHKSNRLRHPLLKNVALAKKMAFDLREPPAAEGTVSWPQLRDASPGEIRRRSGPCRLLGGPLPEQVNGLASYLKQFSTNNRD